MTLKFLLLVLVLGIAVWMLLGRRSKPPETPPSAPPGSRKPEQAAAPERMLVCAHCGVHLPKAEASMDVVGRPYCSDAHRLLGPR